MDHFNWGTDVMSADGGEGADRTKAVAYFIVALHLFLIFGAIGLCPRSTPSEDRPRPVNPTQEKNNRQQTSQTASYAFRNGHTATSRLHLMDTKVHKLRKYYVYLSVGICRLQVTCGSYI